jgi:hypothetical protein
MSKLCPLGHCERVIDRDHQFVFGNNPGRIDIAEDAARRSLAISPSHSAKIDCVAVALHGVARIAKRLKVAQVIGAAEIPRYDVIDLKSADLIAHSAKYAIGRPPATATSPRNWSRSRAGIGLAASMMAIGQASS